ncbi:hypothetical protein Salat_0739700 [Sesamum alatum]|uniref:Myb/SANT-like domain-containing protein n=1 Tax=Sesamum alatum TaxID=300844 RepID=A0AAE1YT97_9LAMI|nr:hypothetical protein Salat_0739700 [Sesamum alatum]
MDNPNPSILYSYHSALCEQTIHICAELTTLSQSLHKTLRVGNKRRAPPQRQYFYKGQWTRRVDICFIDCLAWMAKRGHKQFSYSSQDLEAVQFAMDLVNCIFHRKYDLKFCAHKLEFCRLRYSTYKTILAQPDFDWNPETNRFLAPKEAWDHVFRAAVFPQKGMFEAGPSTSGFKDEAGPSRCVRCQGAGPSVEAGRSVIRNCILVESSDED